MAHGLHVKVLPPVYGHCACSMSEGDAGAEHCPQCSRCSQKAENTITRPMTFVVLVFVGTFISEGLCEVGMRVS